MRARCGNVRDMNPEKAEALSPELQRALEPLLSAIEEHLRVQRSHRRAGLVELLASGAAAANQGRWHVDSADLPADAGRSAPFSQELRCGLLSGTAALTQKLGAEPTADAHQQRRRSVLVNSNTNKDQVIQGLSAGAPANFVGAGSSAVLSVMSPIWNGFSIDAEICTIIPQRWM